MISVVPLLEAAVINLAIIVAVSDYQGDVKPLPACKNDGRMMRTVFEHANRFEEIYEIDTTQSSQTIKRDLADFVKKHHNNEVGEVVFYFSGHGEARTDDVLYFLRDHQKSKASQTSILNSELDDMIRSLSPALFTKICDSCYSGLPYVKSLEDIKDTLGRVSGKFSKIYFMCSSQQNEESFADEKLSDFTGSFGRAICNAENGSLRHRDIMSAIADDFSGKGTQTPFFVAQSDHTDTFIYVNDAVKAALSEFFKDETQAELEEPAGLQGLKSASTFTIAEKIRADAKRYCTKEEAMSAVERLKALVQRSYLSKEFADLYEPQIGPHRDDVPGAAGIGLWLSKNDRNQAYFARPTTKQETYEKRVAVNALATLAALRAFTGEGDGYKLVSDVRTVVDGFHQTNQMEYEYLRIRLQPKVANLAPEECLIVPIFTVTHLRLFWSYSHFRPTDWDKWIRTQEVVWNTELSEIKDDAKVAALVNEIAEGFRKFVEEPLRTQWGGGDLAEGATLGS